MFHKGDRVMVRFPEDLPIENLRYFSKSYKEGECGTVLYTESSLYSFVGVVFDDHNEIRHSLDGSCDDGCGYWVYERFLVLEELDSDYGPIDLSKILEVK